MLSKDYFKGLVGCDLYCGDGGVSLFDSLVDLYMLKEGNKIVLIVFDVLVKYKN